MGDAFEELFRANGRSDITVLDTTAPTWATDAQTAAQLIVLGGTITPVLRTVRLYSRNAGTEWTARNDCATSVEIGGPFGTCVTIPGGGAVQKIQWDGTNTIAVGERYGVADTPGTPGLVSIPDDTTVFLRGDGQWTGVGAGTPAVQTAAEPSAFARAPHQVQVSRTGAGIACIFILPASPQAGDIFEAINADVPNHTLTLSRNGQKINGGTSDLVMNALTGWQRLIFIDATTGWASAGTK